MHQTQRNAADQAGSQGDAGGHQQVPQVGLGVEVGDGHTLVGSGVEAWEC